MSFVVGMAWYMKSFIVKRENTRHQIEDDDSDGEFCPRGESRRDRVHIERLLAAESTFGPRYSATTWWRDRTQSCQYVPQLCQQVPQEKTHSTLEEKLDEIISKIDILLRVFQENEELKSALVKALQSSTVKTVHLQGNQDEKCATVVTLNNNENIVKNLEDNPHGDETTADLEVSVTKKDSLNWFQRIFGRCRRNNKVIKKTTFEIVSKENEEVCQEPNIENSTNQQVSQVEINDNCPVPDSQVSDHSVNISQEFPLQEISQDLLKLMEQFDQVEKKISEVKKGPNRLTFRSAYQS